MIVAFAGYALFGCANGYWKRSRDGRDGIMAARSANAHFRGREPTEQIREVFGRAWKRRLKHIDSQWKWKVVTDLTFSLANGLYLAGALYILDRHKGMSTSFGSRMETTTLPLFLLAATDNYYQSTRHGELPSLSRLQDFISSYGWLIVPALYTYGVKLGSMRIPTRAIRSRYLAIQLPALVGVVSPSRGKDTFSKTELQEAKERAEYLTRQQYDTNTAASLVLTQPIRGVRLETQTGFLAELYARGYTPNQGHTQLGDKVISWVQSYQQESSWMQSVPWLRAHMAALPSLGTTAQLIVQRDKDAGGNPNRFRGLPVFSESA